MEAYIRDNTPELREWLSEQLLFPINYPDSDRPGLTAPYTDCRGQKIAYRDGLRFEDDNDANEFIICHDEEEFKKVVTNILTNINL